MFIDVLQLEMTALQGNLFKGVLKDDNGSICSVLERKVSKEKEQFTWTGLSDLPYGRYTLELSQGENEMKMSLVKRV